MKKIQRHLLIIHNQLIMSENLQDCNQANKKVLIVFGDMIADIEANKKIPNKREL